MVYQHDLDFIARKFETIEIPKEKQYLLKYFKNELQRSFLKYFFVYGDYANFQNHTGIACQMRWLLILHEKLIRLETEYKEAKKELTETSLAKIALLESGKFRFSKSFDPDLNDQRS